MALRSFLFLGLSLAAALLFTHTAARADEAPGQAAKGGKAAVKPAFARDVAPVPAKYCPSCHNDKRRRGDLSLEPFKTDADALKHPRLWEKVAQNLRSGDMPPSGRSKPGAAELDRLLTWIDTQTSEIDCTKS